jgi:hypothetical protein
MLITKIDVGDAAVLFTLLLLFADTFLTEGKPLAEKSPALTLPEGGLSRRADILWRIISLK